jgi:hypothetical protein
VEVFAFLLCHIGPGHFFELSGGQDFASTMATSVSEVSKLTDGAEPIDRSFDREEVARACNKRFAQY